VYFDSAYIVKYYINEPESDQVRTLARSSDSVRSSLLALTEVICVFHRQMRDGGLSPKFGDLAINLFRSHVDEGLWDLAPVSEQRLKMASALVRNLPRAVPIRAGDAIHLATALSLGEPTLWTNDRHLLAAAKHVGLEGRAL
jgi:predicted nucleic acid-binding protein